MNSVKQEVYTYAFKNTWNSFVDEFEKSPTTDYEFLDKTLANLVSLTDGSVWFPVGNFVWRVGLVKFN